MYVCVSPGRDCLGKSSLVGGFDPPSSGIVFLQELSGRLAVLALAMLVRPIYRQRSQLLVGHRLASLLVPLTSRSGRFCSELLTDDRGIDSVRSR